MASRTAKQGRVTAAKRTPRYSRLTPEERRRRLIEAAINCLGEGGVAAFTIDRICRAAGVSRGLINHHFDGKDALLVAVYETMTEQLAETLEARLGDPEASPDARLAAVITASFAPEAFDPAQMRAWLALWGEVSTNHQLQAAHRRLYALYRDGLARAIGEIAQARRREVDAEALAIALIALIDGLWLECCLDPSLLTPDDAVATCNALLAAQIGPIKA